MRGILECHVWCIHFDTLKKKRQSLWITEEFMSEFFKKPWLLKGSFLAWYSPLLWPRNFIKRIRYNCWVHTFLRAFSNVVHVTLAFCVFRIHNVSRINFFDSGELRSNTSATYYVFFHFLRKCLGASSCFQGPLKNKNFRIPEALLRIVQWIPTPKFRMDRRRYLRFSAIPSKFCLIYVLSNELFMSV